MLLGRLARAGVGTGAAATRSSAVVRALSGHQLSRTVPSLHFVKPGLAPVLMPTFSPPSIAPMPAPTAAQTILPPLLNGSATDRLWTARASSVPFSAAPVLPLALAPVEMPAAAAEVLCDSTLRKKRRKVKRHKYKKWRKKWRAHRLRYGSVGR